MDNTGTPRDSRGKIFSGESITLLIPDNDDDVKPYRNRKKKK